ncbi:MAG: tetratricopeptide repeat protein [Kofleriaceae bacterium]
MIARTLAILLTSTVAFAQPAPPPDGGKVDAKSLMQSGVRLLEAKDYLGALAVFRDAYTRFPSAKILLNIGTTQNLLDRKADAGNTYQRYLDSPDADPAKKNDVMAALADIDKSIGRLEITVTPADAEVSVNDGEWLPTASAKLVRVKEGPFTVRVRRDKYGSEAKSAQIVRGDRAAIVIAMTALPEEPPLVLPSTNGGDLLRPEEPLSIVEGPRSKLGILAIAHLDIPRGGGAGIVGATFDVMERVEVHAGAILGPNYGAYAGTSFAILTGNTRPFVAAGVPLFFSSGARVGVRGAGGLEVRLSPKFSLIAELGAEMMLNPEDNILKAAFIPAVGASGRL